MVNKYYHAGSRSRIADQRGEYHIAWSDHTRRSRETAEKEARRIARKTGGVPVVEWWDRSHGMIPRDCEVVEGCDFV